MNTIRTLLENKERASIREDAGHRVYATEEILGSLEPIQDFAMFYHKHKASIELIEASFLLDYCRGVFTREEKLAYEKGLGVWLKFMEACVNDLEAYSKEGKE